MNTFILPYITVVSLDPAPTIFSMAEQVGDFFLQHF